MITTERLILRPWSEQDLGPYAALNADPLVRKYFPKLLSKEESDAEAHRIQEKYVRDGFCFFAAELLEEKNFIGFIGFQTMRYAVPSVSQPAVEIGWRLASRYWRRGLATEGARAALQYAFASCGLKEVIAITVPANTGSRRVMEKIGMKHVPELDFAHPLLTEDHPLSPHVLYKASNIG